MGTLRPGGVVFAGIVVGWSILGIAIIINQLRTSRGVGARKRDWRSVLGLVLQAIAFFMVFRVVRPRGFPMSWMLAIGLAILAIGCSLFGFAAVQTLGRQWSLVARVTDEHRLVMSGPYGLVRHPIYTALLGLLIATGLALSSWAITVGAMVVYLIGTAMRIRYEEGLMIETFGDKYRDYARRVGAIIPKFGASGRGNAR